MKPGQEMVIVTEQHVPGPDRVPGTEVVGQTPARRVVASFSTHEEAERAVGYLSDQRFPVQRTAIVARGIRVVEQVTGRFTAWDAAGRQGLAGAVVGGLFGWLFAVLGWIVPVVTGLVLVGYGVALGAAVGAVLGAGLHLAADGRRDFRVVQTFEADSYDVLADVEVSEEAARLLHGWRTTDTPARPA